MRELTFDNVMSNGRAQKYVDWEKVFYASVAALFVAKGLYFWTK